MKCPYCGSLNTSELKLLPPTDYVRGVSAFFCKCCKESFSKLTKKEVMK